MFARHWRRSGRWCRQGRGSARCADRQLLVPARGSADGRALIESALGHGPVSPATRAYALDALATLSCMQGSFEEALKAAEEALASARCAADPRMEAACLVTVGWAASGLGDASHARVSYEAAVRVGTEVGDDVTVAAALGNLADLALTSGAWAEALAMALRAVKANERAGNEATRAVGLFNVAQAQFALGDIEAAFSPAIDALTILREADRDYLNAWSCWSLHFTGHEASRSELLAYSERRTRSRSRAGARCNLQKRSYANVPSTTSSESSDVNASVTYTAKDARWMKRLRSIRVERTYDRYPVKLLTCRSGGESIKPQWRL